MGDANDKLPGFIWTDVERRRPRGGRGSREGQPRRRPGPAQPRRRAPGPAHAARARPAARQASVARSRVAPVHAWEPAQGPSGPLPARDRGDRRGLAAARRGARTATPTSSRPTAPAGARAPAPETYVRTTVAEQAGCRGVASSTTATRRRPSCAAPGSARSPRSSSRCAEPDLVIGHRPRGAPAAVVRARGDRGARRRRRARPRGRGGGRPRGCARRATSPASFGDPERREPSASPSPRAAAAPSAAPALFAELAAVPAWELPLTRARRRSRPCVIVVGADTPALVREAARRARAARSPGPTFGRSAPGLPHHDHAAELAALRRRGRRERPGAFALSAARVRTTIRPPRPASAATASSGTDERSTNGVASTLATMSARNANGPRELRQPQPAGQHLGQEVGVERDPVQDGLPEPALVRAPRRERGSRRLHARSARAGARARAASAAGGPRHSARAAQPSPPRSRPASSPRFGATRVRSPPSVVDLDPRRARPRGRPAGPRSIPDAQSSQRSTRRALRRAAGSSGSTGRGRPTLASEPGSGHADPGIGAPPAERAAHGGLALPAHGGHVSCRTTPGARASASRRSRAERPAPALALGSCACRGGSRPGSCGASTRRSAWPSARPRARSPRASAPRPGSSALPSRRSATHSDCASAIGMIAPSGCTRPMK